MANIKASDALMEGLVAAAKDSPRPEARLGTLERLVKACNEIESGNAVKVIKVYLGKDVLPSERNFKITATNIEKFVNAKRWTGPKRQILVSDVNLKSYVEAREEERLKPIIPKRASSRRKEIESAIDKIQDIGQRQMLRHALADGFNARNEINLLTKALKNIPGLDYDNLMSDNNGNAFIEQQLSNVSCVLDVNSKKLIRTLVSRLEDERGLSRLGLMVENGRIKSKATGTALIKKDELFVLKKISGLMEDVND
ncbi:hypothetical protein [Terasakiella pusilla]|uniref:hypothetical protein n=1 Tax=Terasakiella pusilla TaxID=64973 RepID=UPI003AA85529